MRFTTKKRLNQEGHDYSIVKVRDDDEVEGDVSMFVSGYYKQTNGTRADQFGLPLDVNQIIQQYYLQLCDKTEDQIRQIWSQRRAAARVKGTEDVWIWLPTIYIKHSDS